MSPSTLGAVFEVSTAIGFVGMVMAGRELVKLHNLLDRRMTELEQRLGPFRYVGPPLQQQTPVQKAYALALATGYICKCEAGSTSGFSASSGERWCLSCGKFIAR